MDTYTVNQLTYGPRETVTVTGSPFTWQNTYPWQLEVIVRGGTVSLIEFSRDGTTWDNVGLLAGSLRLNPWDWVRITHLLAPTLILYPF